MSKVNFLFITLITAFIIAIGGAMYLSGSEDIKTNVLVSKDEKDKEKNLFKEYSIENFLSSASSSGSETGAKADKTIDSLLVLATIPNNTNNKADVDADLMIVFSDFVKLEDLLGYIKGECPSGEKPLSNNNDMVRCGSLNKLFLYKTGGQEEPFMGTVRKSKLNDNAVVLSLKSPLESTSEYTLKIKVGLKTMSSINDKEISLPEDKIVNFETNKSALENNKELVLPGLIDTVSGSSHSSGSTNSGSILQNILENTGAIEYDMGITRTQTSSTLTGSSENKTEETNSILKIEILSGSTQTGGENTNTGSVTDLSGSLTGGSTN